MSIRSELREALPGIFEDMGEAASYTPSGGSAVPCHVFIDFDVRFEPDGMTTQTWTTATVIEALLSELDDAEPNKGDTFVISAGDAAGTYAVQRVLSNDGFSVKMAVK